MPKAFVKPSRRFTKIRKDQILFFSCCFFIIGVGLASFFPLSLDPAWLFVLGAFLLALGYAFPRKSLVFGFFLTGFLGGFWVTEHALARFERLLPGEAQGIVRVIRDPEARDFFRHTVLRFEECEESFCPTPLILWQAPLSSKVEAGERLRFRCQLELPENFDAKFDYRMYLAKDGIGYLCKKALSEEREKDDLRTRLFRALYFPKHFFEKNLSFGLPEPEAGLAKGLLLGGNTYLAKDVKEDFQKVGLSHVVAVSGYNITLIIGCFLLAGLAVGLWRRQALYFSLAGIAFFIVMIGLPASAVRAGVMAGLVFLAREVGRDARSLRVLLFSAVLILCADPLLLRYDIGFILSFLATLALVAVEPLQSIFFQKDSWLTRGLELLFLTSVVTLFLLPVLLFNFGTFSPLILVANFLTLLVPATMALAFVSGIGLSLFPFLGTLISFPTYALLHLLVQGAGFLSHLPYSSVTLANFPHWLFILWYGALFFAIVILERKRKKLFHVSPL